jgi:hypothetical protein
MAAVSLSPSLKCCIAQQKGFLGVRVVLQFIVRILTAISRMSAVLCCFQPYSAVSNGGEGTVYVVSCAV